MRHAGPSRPRTIGRTVAPSHRCIRLRCPAASAGHALAPSVRGFILVELLVAIIVAFVLMAMAAFALVRARAAANESSAIVSLKSINSAQLAYNAACGRGFYARSLTVLGMPPHAAARGGYLDEELSSADVVNHNGYRLRVVTGRGGENRPVDCNNNVTISMYYATAAPLVAGDTGIRAFATNQVGAIWQRTGSIAPAEPFGAPAEMAK